MFVLVGISQCIISLLDIVGVYLILLIVSGTEQFGKTSPSIRLPKILDVFLDQKVPLPLVFSIVVFVFSTKSVIAFILHRFFIRLLGKETNRIIRLTSESIFVKRSDKRLQLTSHDVSFAINEGTEVVYMETLSPAIVLVSDLFLITLILLNILFNAGLIFFPSVFYFLLIFIFLRSANSHYTRGVFKNQIDASILSKSLIQEAYFAIRELTASSKLEKYVAKVQDARKIGVASAENISIARLLPKYVYEIALFVGVALISAISSIFGQPGDVVPFLTLFVISASRLIPSFLRVQYYLGVVQKSTSQSERVFTLLNTSMNPNSIQLVDQEKVDLVDMSATGSFKPNVILKDVTFFHSGTKRNPSLDEVTFELSDGTTTAVIGSSGAGKSTLIDLVLGFHEPFNGDVKISGVAPASAFKIWPGKIAYVPQRITIFNTSLMSNITLDEADSEDEDSTSRVEELLKQVQLFDFVENLPDRVNTNMGELGSRLSGGQIQRLGIARALYSRPSLLILDESTNAIDSSGERDLLDSLFNDNKLTTLLITHNLDAIRNVDQVLYLEQGRLLAKGKFEQILHQYPYLESQIRISNVKFNPSNGLSAK